MRARVPAILVVAGLTYFAVQHKSQLPALPDPTALLLNLRKPPYRFTVATVPEAPSCDRPITLRIHVIDIDGKPANGLAIEAAAVLGGTEYEQSVTLRGKGHGDYEGRVELESAGSWDVNLKATKGFTTARDKISIEVGGAQAEPEDADADDSDS